MKCQNCGNEVSSEALFCVNCGQEIKASPKPEQEKVLFCTNCGAEIESGTSFCGKCGSAVNNRQQEDNPIESTAPIEPVETLESVEPTEMFEPTEPAETFEPVEPEETFKPIEAEKPQKKKNYLPVIIVLSAVILALIAAIVGYFVWSNGTADSTSASPEPTASASPSPGATSTPEVNDKKFDTYYVVNCDVSISLRESPSYSAKVLADVPLGAPVSYVESLQNGFAKVIYNGMTGYALQSYLSSSSSDINKPINTQTPNSSVVSNPSYTLYRDSDYNFVCAYPTHFRAYNDSDPFVRYSVSAPDNTASLKICATKNKSNLSVKTVMDNFKSSYPGTVDYENSGSTWCVVSTYQNGQCHYGYFHVDSNSIKGFEFHHNRNYCSVYEKYIDYIYDSLKFN